MAVPVKLDETRAARSENSPLLLEGTRVLHVLDHSVPIHSGYSFRSLAIFREQRKRGWHTSHLTTPKHTEESEPDEFIGGLRFYRTVPNRNRLAAFPGIHEIALVRSVARRIEEVAAIERPDILHAHSPSLNALAALSAGRRLGIPVVYEVRGFWEDAAVSHGTSVEGGPRYQLTRALESYALRNSAGIATICEGLRHDMLARGVASDRIVTIPNGVDLDKFPFRPAPDLELKSALGLQNKIVLGFLGSFYSYEGLDFLVSCLPEILACEPRAAVLLVGGGPEEDALKEQVASMGLEHAVRFVSRVPHDEIERYYSLVDIFIYPRHRMRLTDTVTPLKPLEAMALGGIVLGSDVGGHRELVREGKTGRLFKADDRDSLVGCVLDLVANMSHLETMRLGARQFVEQERNWEITTSGYRELYARALVGRTPSKIKS